MPSRRTTPALALATALVLAGCGGAGSSSPQSTPVVSPAPKPPTVDASATVAVDNPGTPRAQFLAFANAINLRPQDMAGFAGKPKSAEHGARLVNSLNNKAQFERCLGVGKETKPIFKRSSEKFEASSGTLHYLAASSEVQVTRTRAMAQRELTIARRTLGSPTKRGCLARAVDAMLGGSHTTHPGGRTLRITIGNVRVAPILIGTQAGTDGGYGMTMTLPVTYAFTVRGRHLTVPGAFTIDVLQFTLGRAGVELTTMAFGQPFPSQREVSLFSLLIGRALTASGRAPVITR